MLEKLRRRTLDIYLVCLVRRSIAIAELAARTREHVTRERTNTSVPFTWCMLYGTASELIIYDYLFNQLSDFCVTACKVLNLKVKYILTLSASFSHEMENPFRFTKNVGFIFGKRRVKWFHPSIDQRTKFFCFFLFRNFLARAV